MRKTICLGEEKKKKEQEKKKKSRSWQGRGSGRSGREAGGLLAGLLHLCTAEQFQTWQEGSCAEICVSLDKYFMQIKIEFFA
jgi:hypothetical protein